jgi:two-component sensor histidine kinase
MKNLIDTLGPSWRSWISGDLDVKGPAWLQWVWTLLFCVALALAFTVLGVLGLAHGSQPWPTLEVWQTWLVRNLVITLTIGACIHTMFRLAARWIGGQRRLCTWKPWQRSVFFAGIPMLGVLIGWPLGLALLGRNALQWLGGGNAERIIVGSVALSLLISFLIHQFFALKSRQIEAERRAAETQLRLLQGQIEPHFLFNTLAGVAALIEPDPSRARQTLEAFTDYLRASLGTLRKDEGTLAQELELAEQYLRLMQARMDERLQFSIEADAGARQALLPPLLLQPLVENAVKHGLEPAVAGGRVQVQARLRGGRLQVDVIDDGQGLQAAGQRGRPAGFGLALDNIRSRLRNRYGSAATLTLHDGHPGTRASLSLPWDGAAS